MSRRARTYQPDMPYQIVQRGNSRECCFLIQTTELCFKLIDEQPWCAWTTAFVKTKAVVCPECRSGYFSTLGARFCLCSVPLSVVYEHSNLEFEPLMD